jgi:hypothetical protein
MVPAPLVALVNQRLQVQKHIRIGWAQRNTDGGQALAQADGIHLVLTRARRSDDTNCAAGARSLEDIPNGLGEDPSALPHEVHFHEIGPATE